MKKFSKILVFLVAIFAILPLFPAEELTFETICKHLAAYKNTTGEFTQIKTEIFGNFHPHERRCRLENAEAGSFESRDNRRLHDLD